MNFDKIELIGFKSFADKLEIKFEAGVTGIVGPNGCGKSNVADAVRWVLGEQSAKTLRGSSMQDVIFNGTQNRKSLSYCEVSLYFDNTNRIFPTMDYNEVVITRKLYRSGESEYYINKQIARLKDIVELLHECGIGKEGYSIIGQGKVEEILSSKPEDRRAIFEEATGIAKFKSKKADIERKLIRTRENLIRYIDILSELERQLGPLSKQAEDARKYNALMEELKYHEINHYIYKFNNVYREKEKVNTRIAAIEEEVQNREDEYDKIQKEYEANSFAIIDTDERIQEVNNRILENSIAYEKRLGDVKLYGERINSCKAEIKRMESVIESLKDRERELRREILERENERTANTALLQELDGKATVLGVELSEIMRELEREEGATQESQKKIINSLETLADIKVNFTSLTEKKLALTEKQQDIIARINALKSKMNGISAEGTGYQVSAEELTKKNDDLRALIDEKEKLRVAINDKVKEFNAKLFSLNNQLASTEARETLLNDMKRSYEGFAESVKFLLRSAASDREMERRIKGVVAKLIKTEKLHETAIETALGGSMQSVVTATPDDTKYLIDFLKRKNGGRVTFLPISTVRARYDSENIKSALKERGAIGLAAELVSYDAEFDGVMRNLLGNTLVVDGIDNAIAISKKYVSAFKIVTLDGELFSTQGSITGGSTSKNMKLLGGDRQLDTVKQEIDAIKESIEKGQRLVSEYEERGRKISDEIGVINENIHRNKESISVYTEKALICGADYNRCAEELNAYEGQISGLSGTLEDILREYTSAEEGNQKLNAQKRSADDDLKKNQTAYEGLKKKREELSAEYTALKLRIAEINSCQSVIASDINRLNAELNAGSESLERENISISSTEEVLKELLKSAESIALTNEEQSALSGMRGELEDLEEKKRKIMVRQAETDRRKHALQTEILGLSEKKGDEEIALGRIDSDMEHLQERIMEEYNCDHEACMRYHDPEYDASASVSSINKLKREKLTLKNVNPNAIDDFNSTNDRYQEMKVQKEDVEKGENDLMIALETLTQEMVKQFNEGFDKINENFKRTFKELFGGGNARLELDYTDVEDPLEAGIEIVAEPPGKKLQKISLLSGGERALTAIAILFSIIQLRPMPFCLLDEIEAALDDANVDRFARYLKKFSQNTQFIVITHRKPTMEMADALFGVTMEEKGISKMVSVKLSDIEDLSTPA